MTREEMMQKAEIERQYRTVDGIIRDPGKFYGCPVWAVALYDWWMDGCADKEGGNQEEGTNAWAAFKVDEDMRAVYPELAGFAVGIEETDNGFIYSQELTEAEFDKLDKPSKPSGYSDCPCRDCFEIAMDGDLCSECEEAGCSADGDAECESPEAYGGEDAEGRSAHHDCNQIWAEMADPSCYQFETFEAWHAACCARE